MQEKTTQKTLPPDETALFCEQVAMVLKAGIPLSDGMETLARSYADSCYGARFEQICAALEKRGTLSDALSEADIFPDYLVAMTRIGERSGKLDEVMASLANYYQWEAQIKSSVKNAILYPSVLVMMLAVVIAILVISVIPVFQRVFDSLGLSAGSAASGATCAPPGTLPSRRMSCCCPGMARGYGIQARTVSPAGTASALTVSDWVTRTRRGATLLVAPACARLSTSR